MPDPLYELLVPHLEGVQLHHEDAQIDETVAAIYFGRLSMLQLSALDTTEPQSLAQASHSALLSLQSLSSRSSRAVIASADHLAVFKASLPSIGQSTSEIQRSISSLDSKAVTFSEKYSRTSENEVLDRRKKALLMSRNADRVSDILDLPTLLSSTISPSSLQSSSNASAYNSALDLHSHIKNLHLLYPDSRLLQFVYLQAEDVMRDMTSNLISSLQSQNLKVAAAIRTVGWLRRVAPELDGSALQEKGGTGEGSLGTLFLICRLGNLVMMLEALEPLRELAEQESQKRLRDPKQLTNGNAWSGGQQTEKYLKRYIEIFREQSFAIVSMFKGIFPKTDPIDNVDLGAQFQSLGLQSSIPLHQPTKNEFLQSLSSALSNFPLHLVGLLMDTLTQYLPNIRDKSSRESLLTQVLYCAGSLGRLGGDFSLMLAQLHEENDDDDDDGEDDDKSVEWVAVMKKHRTLADRLQLLSSGPGAKGGKEVNRPLPRLRISSNA